MLQVETGENNALMPLRFVWGVVPEDNGDHLDPASRGTLQIDFTFDMAAPDSQAFLMKFCHNLRLEPTIYGVSYVSMRKYAIQL